jgi:hypothetical protein
MEAILARLLSRTDDVTEKRTLERLAASLAMMRRQDAASANAQESARKDYVFLNERGFWADKHDESEMVRQQLQPGTVADVGSDRLSTSSKIQPSLTTQTIQPAFPQNMLPPELIQTIERTHTLHLLATRPKTVLPPGKTLVSALVSAAGRIEPSEPSSALQSRVEQVVHTAFWDEVSLRFSPFIYNISLTPLP